MVLKIVWCTENAYRNIRWTNHVSIVIFFSYTNKTKSIIVRLGWCCVKITIFPQLFFCFSRRIWKQLGTFNFYLLNASNYIQFTFRKDTKVQTSYVFLCNLNIMSRPSVLLKLDSCSAKLYYLKIKNMSDSAPFVFSLWNMSNMQIWVQ